MQSEIAITIVDYGVGNLFSISRAIEAVGAKPVLGSNVRDLLSADRLLLPGVGAFGAGMAGLADKGLSDAVIEFSKSGKPMMGICLGMQMLMTTSEEYGEHQGLGIIPGHVKQLPTTTADGKKLKIPHIGWNSLHPTPSPGIGWKGTILEDTTAGDSVYFVHSFAVVPDNPNDILAVTYYGGYPFCSVINHGSVYGCQFHPEKSGEVGLNILRGFTKL